jgi:invasion protein IalB
MLRLTKLIAACAVLAFATHQACAAGSETGTGQVKAMYGAWKLKCGQIPGAKQQEKCVLVQDLALEDERHMFMTVIILRTFDGDKKYLRVVAPLGMLLPAGLGLKVDGQDVGHVPFIKCVREGCVAEAIVDDQLLAKFSSGQTASFIVFPAKDKGIGFPAPLSGFAEGLKALN